MYVGVGVHVYSLYNFKLVYEALPQTNNRLNGAHRLHKGSNSSCEPTPSL